MDLRQILYSYDVLLKLTDARKSLSEENQIDYYLIDSWS